MRIETPQTRYHELSEMLSGVKLYERRPQNCIGDFYDFTRDERFCGRWSPEEISQLLADTGCIAHWDSLGFSDLRIEIGHDFNNQYELSVWTRFADCDERLLYLIVWLEYIEIERLSVRYPTFCVEHLRLQLPGKAFDQTPMPGQDYASSGLLRRVFGMIKLWATQTGAALITEIPQYFHTAYLFSPFFEYIDPEMAALFRAMKQDLLPAQPTKEDITRLSFEFENGRITRNGELYLWPTEMQGFALSHEVAAQIRLSDNRRDSGVFSRKD